MDDLEAMAALRNGDVDALDVLVARHQPKALRVAYVVTQDRSLAEDAVQDAFIRAYRSAATFDSTRAVEPWLMRIVVNRAVDIAKRSRRERSLDEATEGVIELAARLRDPSPGPPEAAEASETNAEILAAMRLLSPAERAVVVQRYYLELSDKEIAFATDRAVGTVKHLMFRARRKLRILLTRRVPEQG
ncbi:MAG: RNA polymerase sigma factor [Chloroflexi bacterium]|nr:RNA polymerase sigma factor [Chloroflexota bacterium]MDA1173626.1 RNA polymerase sigma factor [Chloroflexota bacterium]